MKFIKILFNIAFAVLPLLMLLLLQIINPVLTVVTRTENIVQQNTETTTLTSITAAIKTTTTTATTTINNNNKNNNNNNNNDLNKNNTETKQQQTQQHGVEIMRKHERIIDNSIDFTVDPCDDFYQYACGEWKQQLYDETQQLTTNTNHNSKDDNDDGSDALDNFDDEAHLFGSYNATNADYKYDRTLAMIDYLADKEVLKYFHEKNHSKYTTINKNASLTTTTIASKKTNTTKEPDFIIKVYKYYKSCIAIQQYEPIKYLEWLELNEHVKWPSLINTTNSEEHDNDYGNNNDDNDDADEHKNVNTNRKETTVEGEEHEHEEIVEIIMDDDVGDNKDGAIDATTETTSTTATTATSTSTTTTTSTSTNTAKKHAKISKYIWINTLAILRKYGLNGIFIEEIIYTTKTYPSKLFLGFNKPIYEGGFHSLKMDNLKTILQHLNETYTKESFKELWLKVSKFEWQLIKLNDITDELGTNMLPLEHLPVDWLADYLMVLFNQSQPLDSRMRVVISNVAYFIALDDLLKEYDDYFLQQYLKIRFLWHLYQQQPQEFSPLDCIQHIKRFQPLAFEWIYEHRHSELKPEIPKIFEIYSNLRRQFNLTLYNNRNNFNSATLEKFVNKLENMQLKVGTFTDHDAMQAQEFFYENRKFYKTLTLSSRHYYANHLKMLKFNFDCLHFGLRNVGSTSIYYDMKEYNTGLISSAYYNRRLNTVNIPLSLLQPPIYHKQYSEIFKYSTLGFILGQTLMYGFNLNDLALDGHQQHHFKCLNNLDSSQVNDKIADVSGFRLAYHSFFFNSRNQNLISNRKMFFLNFAQSFCATHTSDDTMGRSYVNYALAQFSEFAKVFECPPDSHMNPHEKCYLWD